MYKHINKYVCVYINIYLNIYGNKSSREEKKARKQSMFGGGIFNQMVRKGLADKATFEQ